MQVHVQPAAGALQRRDHVRLPTFNATFLGAPRVHAEQHARVQPQHRAAQAVIPRHLVPKSIRHRQHPLPHRHPWQHRVHQMGGPLGHPAATARTPPAPFTRKRHEALVGGVVQSSRAGNLKAFRRDQEIPPLANGSSAASATAPPLAFNVMHRG